MPNLNKIPVDPALRQPRGAVKLSGVIISRDSSGNEISRKESPSGVVRGWVSWEVDNNAYRSADSFRVVFVIADLPKERGIDWFSSQSLINVEIFGGFPENPENYSTSELSSLIYGQVDNVRICLSDGVIELTGRDLTALLIDTKSSDQFPERTSSDIAKAIAERHGLEYEITETYEKVGDYYQQQYWLIRQEQSDWELLTFLANQEGFSVFVSGKKLYFIDREKIETNSYLISWQQGKEGPISNAITLEFNRSLTISKGVSVEVHSWNAKNKKGYSASWPKAAKSIAPGQASAKTQVYKFNIAGLTQDAALKRAQSIYQQIVAHEMQLLAYLPADGILNCRKTIQVKGTKSAYDQIYYPESVIRTMSMIEGYRMNIRAKNASPELKVNT